MNRFCPNYNIKEVFDGFNEIVEALGGKPMTAEEFKSGELRMLRTGLDFAAVEAAYNIYDKNNGNFLDFAPNGERSILFQEILDRVESRADAIRVKANLFSNKFLSKLDLMPLDKNGEPTISSILTKEARQNESSSDAIGLKHKFSFASITSSFGIETGSLLLKGLSVSSKDILSHMYVSKSFSPSNTVLGFLLQKHDIPVRFAELPIGSLMKTVYDKNGGSVILVDPDKVSQISNQYLSDKFLHEMVHALTILAINDPKTQEDLEFKKYNKQIFDLFDKLFPKERFSRIDPLFYILTNEKEFASEFATDEDARILIFSKAISVDNSKTCLNYIKRFINSLSKLIVNKNIFTTTEEKVKQYLLILNNYLIQKLSVIKGNISDLRLYKAVYSSMKDNVVFSDYMADVKENWSKIIDGFESSDILDFKVSNVNPRRGRYATTEESREDLKQLSNAIAEMLTKRLAAIRVSNLSELIKTKHSQILLSLISQFKSDVVSDFLAISNFLSQVAPELLEDCKKIRRIRDNNLSTTDAAYMYYQHDHFGVYAEILGQLHESLNTPSILNEILNLMMNDPNLKNAVINDVERLVDLTKETQSLAELGVKIMRLILLNNIKQRVQSQVNLTHDATLIEYLDLLEAIGYDTTSVLLLFGSADKAKDSGLRMLYNIVSSANRKAERDVQSVSEDLNILQSRLSFGESVRDLYEVDENGLTTGYLVRDLNFGRFFKDYKNFIKDLNIEFGIDNVENRIAPDDNSLSGFKITKFSPEKGNYEVELTKKEYFNYRKNKWLSKHCERKYKPEYYDAFDLLSRQTREARDLIQGLIRTLKSKCLEEDGYYHFEKLTKEEWLTLNSLYNQKRLLASDYDINGDLKTPGTVQYTIAKELLYLNKTLYSKEHKIQKNYDKWVEARNKIIEKAGGKQEMLKGRTSDSEFDWKMLDNWDERNSKTQLKLDEDGKSLLLKRINEEIVEQPIYEVDNDGGKKYQELTDQINKLLNPYRNYNTGDVNPSQLPKAVLLKIKAIDKERDKIKRLAKRASKNVKLASKQAGKVFAKYAMYKYTDAYKKMLSYAQAMDIDQPGYLDSFKSRTGRYIIGQDGEEIEFRPYRWFTKMVAKPEYQEEFMEIVPGDGWINTDENDDLLNKNFDASYGMSYIPKRDIYDNSKLYNKIKNSKTLSALYDKTLSIMKTANSMQTNRIYHDDYLLPLIEGSLWKYGRGKGFKGKLYALYEWVKDNTGILSNSDTDYGEDVNNALNSEDDLGKIVNSKVFLDGSTGTRPDGRQLNLIPIPYTKKLQDTSKISSDLVGIVSEYYKASSRFKYRNEIKDTAESIVDMMWNRVYMVKTLSGSKVKLKGAESNTYRMARKFLDMNLYDIRTNSNTVTINGTTINLGKVGSIIKMFVTVINLGCNIAVAATGALTAFYSHLILAITGQHYSLKIASQAGLEVVYRHLINLFGLRYIGNNTTNDKLMLIAEEFDFANLGESKRTHTNRNRILESINKHKTFGMLTGLDFIVKSQIAVSTLMSYRLVDGHFTTVEDIKMNGWNKSVDEVKNQIEKWNNGVCLYSVINGKNNKFHVDEKYASAYNEIEDVIHARILKYSENADGMATPELKALITLGFVGSCILIHRQYLPLMLNERLGHIIYDQDTQEYANGDFRTLTNFLRYGLTYTFSKDSRNKFKELFGYDLNNLDLLNSDDTNKMIKAQMSKLRRYQLKKISAELLLYHLLISPVVTSLISSAKDEDKKDKRLYQLIVYILTRFMWESYTPYRAEDLFNNVKSPSAATSMMDKLESAGHSFYKTLFPQQTLYDTFFNSESSSKQLYDPNVKRGVYKNMPYPLNKKLGRDLFKLFVPAHNAVEQWYDARTKENYYTNLIMHLED